MATHTINTPTHSIFWDAINNDVDLFINNLFAIIFESWRVRKWCVGWHLCTTALKNWALNFTGAVFLSALRKLQAPEAIFFAVLPVPSADLLLLFPPPSCTMRTTPRRLRPASSPALRPRRPHPARMEHPALSLLLRQRGCRNPGVRGRERCLRLLMHPSTWEQRLQPLVCEAVLLFVCPHSCSLTLTTRGWKLFFFPFKL